MLCTDTKQSSIVVCVSSEWAVCCDALDGNAKDDEIFKE